MTSVATERTRLAAVGMDLRRREEWGSTYDYSDARAVEEPATDQYVHISITNPSNYSSDDAHARAIEAIGKARFPNTGISYNRLLFRSGAAMEGQPIGRRGAHTVNDDQRTTCGTTGCPSQGQSVGRSGIDRYNLNYIVRSYVIAQNVDDSVTSAQLDSLARAMAADQLAGFVVKAARIHGHRCVSSKSCPADKMWALMDELETRINHYLIQGDVDDMTSEEHNMLVEIRDRLANWENVPNDASTEPDDQISYQPRAQRNYARINETVVGMRQLLNTPPGSTVVSDLTDEALAKLADAVAAELAERLTP